MHIPDGFLDGRTCAATYCLAGGGLLWAGQKLQGRDNSKAIPLMGVMAAFIFAGQMVNFPIPGGTSAHLLGGMLAAICLGPSGAAIVMSLVLVVQCFLFQDGGVTTLGANIFNMGLIGPMAGYPIYRAFRRLVPGRKGVMIGTGVACWVAVMVSAIACGLELAVAGTLHGYRVLLAMATAYAVVGVAEAAITVPMVSVVYRIRPDLLDKTARSDAQRMPLRRLLIAGALAAFGVALLVAPLASTRPEWLGMHAAANVTPSQKEAAWDAPWPNYRLFAGQDGWWDVALAGGVGAAATLMAAWGIGWCLRRSHEGPSSLDCGRKSG